MKRAFLIGLVLATGCNLYFGSSEDDAGVGSTDAWSWFDARPLCLSCNPVAQTGCQAGEKCAPLLDRGEGFCTYTTCVPNGDVPNGEACTVGPQGPATSYDDCVGGNVCVEETCMEICTQAPDSCGAGEACRPVEGVFEDLEGVGVCEPTCDVLAQDCIQQVDDEFGTGCYISLLTGSATCAPALPETEGGTPGVHGEDCMFLNTCAVGHGCTQLDDPVNTTGDVCAFFCDADDAGGPTCSDGPGDQLTCVAINGEFYGDAENVDMNIGFCVDCVVWADVPGCM